MYLGPIISQHLDILHQSQRLVTVCLQMMSWNQGAVHKEGHLPQLLGSLDKCNGLWPLREPCRSRLRFIRKLKVALSILYHF